MWRCSVPDSRSDADAKLDEALEETFPASDPLANTVETGIRISGTQPPASGSVTDNRMKSRFELFVNGETAFLAYERTDNALTLIHTEVPAALRGLHFGEALVEAALRSAHSAGLRIIAVCPFVRAYMRRHSGQR
jgi:predicted GNAT family acetyltransferase